MIKLTGCYVIGEINYEVTLWLGILSEFITVKLQLLLKQPDRLVVCNI